MMEEGDDLDSQGALHMERLMRALKNYARDKAAQLAQGVKLTSESVDPEADTLAYD